MAEKRSLIEAGEGKVILSGGFGVVGKLSGRETGGSFSVVEHPMEPGVLAAPLHTHTNEDEYSLVVEGEVGVRIGDEEFVAGPGAYISKPRGVPHTFWNPGPDRARVVEIIAPSGLERYFEELAEALSSGGEPDIARIIGIAAKYGLTLHMESVPELLEKHGLTLG